MAAAVAPTSRLVSHRPPSPEFDDEFEKDDHRSRQAGMDEEWTIFGPARTPSSQQLSGTADSWSVSSSGAAQAGALPTHDGQGVFLADSAITTSIYVDVPSSDDWADVVAERSASTRSSDLLEADDLSLSLSGSLSSDANLIPRAHPSFSSQLDDHVVPPLTAHALSNLAKSSPPSRLLDDDQAVFTSSSESEASAGPDGDEELLSRTPQATSAGISARRGTTKSRRRRDPKRQPYPTPSPDASDVEMADANAMMRMPKRRHRKSGVSDKGSKRSNTSGSQAPSASMVNRVKSSRPIPKSAQSTPRPSHRGFLTTVVRNVFDVDDDTLDLLASQKTTTDTPYVARSRMKWCDLI